MSDENEDTLPTMSSVASDAKQMTMDGGLEKAMSLVKVATTVPTDYEQVSSSITEIAMPLMASAIGASTGEIRDLRMYNIQVSKGSSIGGPQFKQCTIENLVVNNLPLQLVESDIPDNQDIKDNMIRDYLLEQMKTVMSGANRFTPATWNARYKIDIVHMFTDLDLLKENNKKQDAKPTTLQEVQNIIQNTPECRVLIEGEGGIGKSTLLRLFAYNWAVKKDRTFDGKLLFLLNIRDIKTSVLDAILTQIDLFDFEEQLEIENGFKYIKRFIRNHDDEVVLLLDGLDELKKDVQSPISIFSKRQFKRSKVILTTRPGKIDEFITESDVQVNVKGFSISSIENYIRKYFECCENIALGEELINELRYEIEDGMYTICKNPMLLLTICTIWEDKKSLPSDISTLFKEVYCCIMNQYISKHDVGNKISCFENTPERYVNSLVALGRCMYKGLKVNKLSINRDEMVGEEHVIELALKLGFVYKDAPNYKHDFEEVFTPPHKLILESLVGLYLSKVCTIDSCGGVNSQIKSLEVGEWEVVKMNVYFEMARVFAVGFLDKEADKFLKHWITNDLSTFRPLVNYLFGINNKNRIHVDKILTQYISESCSEIKLHIPDICNSLAMCIHNVEPNFKTNLNVFQLIRKVRDLEEYVSIMKLLGSEHMVLNPEIQGKIIAHLLVVVTDQSYVLNENVYLLHEGVIKILMSEFKKHNLRYDVSDLPNNCNHPLLIAHLIWNSPHITDISIDSGVIGSAMNNVAKEYFSDGVLKLNCININMYRYGSTDLSEIDGASLASLLSKSPNLKDLTLINCNISGDVINDMVTDCCRRCVLLDLKVLIFDYNNLTTIKVATLAQILMLPKLKMLKMQECMLSGNIVNSMIKISYSKNTVLNVKHLDISYNDLSAVTAVTIVSLLNMAPRLAALGLRSCKLLGTVLNDAVREISCTGIPLKLKTIDISGSNLATVDKYFLALLSKIAPELTSLDMNYCMLSGDIVNDMIKMCSNRGCLLKLTSLGICKNNLNSVEGSSLTSLLAMAPELKYFDMNDCMLSAHSVNNMIQECSDKRLVLSLQWFRLTNSNLSKIDPSLLISLLEMAPKLFYLKLKGCLIPDDVIRMVKSSARFSSLIQA